MKPMRAYANILKLRANMALRREAIRNYPTIAYIEPTLYCNLRCPACPTGLQLGLRPAASLQWDMFTSIIDDIGDYVFVLEMFNWGEPLLHKQTPELIQYAKSKQMEVRLSSNLSLRLTDDYIERLVRSGLDRLIVSLDGATAETYEKYRRQGDFSLVRANMLRIQAVKAKLGVDKPEVTWQFLVFQHNEHELDTVKANYKNWGADTLELAGAQIPSEPHREGFAPSTIPEYNIYDLGHPSQLKTRQILSGDRPCSWLYGAFVLNPNGKVSPCCACPAEKDDFGEYSPARGFLAVWDSERFRRARRLFATIRNRGKAHEPSQVQLEGVAKRLEGMASTLQATLDEGQLICERCPIPFRQDDVDIQIRQISHECANLFVSQRDLRYVAALLLMGVPDLSDVRMIFRKLLRR